MDFVANAGEWLRNVAQSFALDRDTTTLREHLREAQQRADAAEVEGKRERERAAAADLRETTLREHLREAQQRAAAADLRAAAADLRAAAADLERNRAEGSLWLTAADLKLVDRDLPAAVSFDRPTSKLFASFDSPNFAENRWLLSPIPNESTCTLHVAPNYPGRNPPREAFSSDVFSEHAHTVPDSNLAHLAPHSPQCREEWAAVLQMMCPELTDKQAQMMMFGFDDNTHGFVQRSNVTWKQWNYINMAAQGELFDKDPQVGFFVAMSWKDQQQWGGKGFSALVVATSPNVYMRINACGSQKSNNTWTVSATEIEEVQNIFNSFADALVQCTVHLRRRTCNDDGKKFLRGLRRKLLTLSKVPAPTIQAQTEHLHFLRVKFGDCLSPGARACSPPPSHPAPHPVLLTIRAINFWYNFLFQHETPSPKNEKYCVRLGITPTEKAEIPQQAAVLMPSCRDLCDSPDCILCQDEIARSGQHGDECPPESVRALFFEDQASTSLKLQCGSAPPQQHPEADGASLDFVPDGAFGEF